jgi:hypothetical protein
MLEPPAKRHALAETCFVDSLDSFDVDLSGELSMPGDRSFTDRSSDDDDDIALFGQDFVLNEDSVDPDEVDSLLAQEFAQLSTADREKVLFDLHGVSAEVKETPEMIQDSVLLLRKALESTPGTQAYKKALALDPAYVHNQGFLLKFLRADRFDIPAAAVRLAKFFEFKLDLFGEDLLVKDITQDDLDQQDLDALYSGRGYTLPFRDLAGRLIVFMLPQRFNKSVRSFLRNVSYATMVHCEDEETQRKGQIHISYLLGQKIPTQQLPLRQEINQAWAKLLTGMPLRIEAIHMCADSPEWRPIFAKFKASATLFTRARIREHIGDADQVLFSLQTFGVPTHGFPILSDEETLAQLSVERTKKRRLLEQMRKQAAEQNTDELDHGKEQVRVGTPGQNDVLLGRGRAFYSHVGNLRLKNIVIERSKLYESAGHTEKQRVSADIVKLIQSRSGRFLRDDGAGWVEVDDETAIKKVSHGFRTLRGLKNAQNANPKSDVKRKLSSER